MTTDTTLHDRLLELADKPYDAIRDVHAVAELCREAAAALAVRGDVEIRLWDSQWGNVVNHANSYRECSKESAIAHAVRMTEDYMRANYVNNTWPPGTKPGERDAGSQPQEEAP